MKIKSIRRWMALLFVIPAAQVQAGYGAEQAVPFIIGGTVLGISSLSTGGAMMISGGSTGTMVLAATSIVSGSMASTFLVANYHKELMIRVKVDHDTYLTGGEMTPFLQGVYREVMLLTREFDRKDGRNGERGIDEDRMTAAIDGLVARMEASGRSDEVLIGGVDQRSHL